MFNKINKMKKLLLTIFAIAAIVACDKDAYDNDDVTNINVLEQAEEINASVELPNDDVLDIINSVLGTNLMKGSERGEHNLASKADNRVTMHLFSRAGVTGLALVDDTNDRFCFNAIDGVVFLNSVHLNKQSGSNNIEVTLGENPEVISTLNGDYSTLFNTPINLLLMLDSAGLITEQGIFNSYDVGTAGSTVIRFGCAGDYYSTDDAPFPLDGHLATITDALGITNAFGGSSRTFAGTNMEGANGVIATIEAEIINGQNNQ